MKKALYLALFTIALFALSCSSGTRSTTTAKNYKANTKADDPSARPTASDGAPGVAVGEKSSSVTAKKVPAGSAAKAKEVGVTTTPTTYDWTPSNAESGYNGVGSAGTNGAAGAEGPTGPTDTPAPVLTKSELSHLEVDKKPEAVKNALEVAALKNNEAKMPKAGQITAAEWNDLHNWQDWNELIEKPAFKNVKDSWDIQLRQRYSVFVTNNQDLPVVDAQVALLNGKGNIIWEARTDNAGKVELWNGIGKAVAGVGSEAQVKYDGQTFRIKKLKSIEDGVNNLQIPVDCKTPSVAEIMFVVDATGSMGDEINFLKAELGDVITRVQNLNEDLNVRLGSVFYRDQADKYITRASALSSDISQTTQFIQNQTAGGGGDYPEAVDQGLELALNQDWSEEAVSRIVFLLLDAPPHDDEASKERMREMYTLAAQKGIKIVPVSASGINRPTEFLLKFASIITNGTYVFITDDSGIGNPHLTPVVSDFQVEFLNDALVRIIESYTRQNSCAELEILADVDDEVNEESDESQTVESDSDIDEELIDQQIIDEDQTSWLDEIILFPNPANTYVNVKTPRELDRVDVVGASGIVLITETNVGAGTTRIDLEPLVDGFYFLQCYSGSTIETKKLVKKRSKVLSFK